jgi:hypothetical protein
MVEPTEALKVINEDQSDSCCLECAIEGIAQYIISRFHDSDREKGLVVATDFRGAAIGKQFDWVGRSPPVYA